MIELLKRPVRWILPAALRRRLKAKWRGEPYTPDVGEVRFGDLRRVTPICRDFGWTRGPALDRAYIEDFLERNRSDIRGKVLEIGDHTYTKRFGGDRVTHSGVLHAVAGNPEATIVGDLQTGENVPEGEYDCMILTQALHVIFDFRSALRHCVRALKPGGVLLMTAPGITQISMYDYEAAWGDHWRFTPLSVKRLLGELVSEDCFTTREYGNVLAAISFLQGLSSIELTREELDFYDPEFTMIIGARVVKPQ